MPGERLLFITGRLAEHALRQAVAELETQIDSRCHVEVLPISVAALLYADWILRKLPTVTNVDRVILPGWVQGDIAALASTWNIPVVLGPKDLRDLPEFFGHGNLPPPDLSRWNIEILAEINHAPRLTDSRILEMAAAYRDSGADIIDLGCIPGESWSRSGEVTRLLHAEGFRISIDSFDRSEVTDATRNGAELLLSCNGSNREWAAELGVELVVIPDDIRDVRTLLPTIQYLETRGVKYRLDPVLEPIGLGFAESLGRYLEVRRLFPNAEIMCGIGNLTELSEVDSAGVNLLLAGFCEELGIRSVLTTEVINWSRTAVREFDLARRLVAHAVSNRVLPKHVDPRLVILRDSRLKEQGAEALERLARQIRDPNFRLFAEREELHAINRDGHRHAVDPFTLFEQLGPLDPSHAFYLGYELCKAVTALTLGKNYTQDQALQWGFLTRPESSHRHRDDTGNGTCSNP